MPFISPGNLGLFSVKEPTVGIKTHENLPHKLMPQSCTTVGQRCVQDTRWTSKSAVTWQINQCFPPKFSHPTERREKHSCFAWNLMGFTTNMYWNISHVACIWRFTECQCIIYVTYIVLHCSRNARARAHIQQSKYTYRSNKDVWVYESNHIRTNQKFYSFILFFVRQEGWVFI